MKSLMFTKLLLNAYDPKANLNCLSAEEKGLLEKIEIASIDPTIALFRPSKELEKIHYSWIQEAFEKIPSAMQPFVFSSLPLAVQEKLVFSRSYSLSTPFIEYFLHYFYRSMGGRERLPLELIKPTPLLFLPKASKEVLVKIVDILSVHDLIGEFQQIIDTQQIQRIILALKEEQREYLKKHLHQKERWSPVKLGLEQWSGDQLKFAQILHRRGLNRLAMALKEESPDFLWHLLRRFDKGRAAIIEKERGQECKNLPVSYFVNQVINAFKFVQRT